jgi:predicted acylesterase/phospholipase RssA
MKTIIRSILISIAKFVNSFTQCLRLFSSSVIPLVMVYFILVYLDQGQDVLILVLENPGASTGLFMLTATIWSGLLWYPSRLLSQTPHRFSIPERWSIAFPRLMGYNALVALHTAIFCLPQVFNCMPWAPIKEDHLGWWALGYIAFYNGLFLLFSVQSQQLTTVKERRRSFLYLCIGGVAPWAFFSYFILRENLHAWTTTAVFMAVLLVLIQSGAFVFQLWRRAKIEHRAAPEHSSPWFVKAQVSHRLLPTAAAKEPITYSVFVGCSLLGLLSFLLAWISASAAVSMGPLIITLVSLAVISTVFSFVKALSILRSIPILWVYMLCLVLAYTILIDPYQSAIATCPSEKDERLPARLALKQRLEHVASIDSVAYIVLADGGGARSGYWTSLVLNDLNKKMNGTLPDHILMMSSTSGGTIGNGVFLSQMNSGLSQDLLSTRCDTFFTGDFLSHTLATMVVPDLTGLSVLIGHDRGHALVDAMKLHAEHHQFGLDQFSLNTSQAGYTQPLVFFNTCSMVNGRPGVVANVRLHDLDTYRIDVLSGGTNQCYPVSFVDQMILSARFPFVSPAGQIADQYYVDGGYFDNTGAAIVADVLYDGMKDTGIAHLLKKMELRIIHITNDIVTDSLPIRSYKLPKSVVPHQQAVPQLCDSTARDRSEKRALASNYAAPVATVLGTYSSQTGESNDQFLRLLADTDRFSAQFYQVNLFDERYLNQKTDIQNEYYLEGYPMSWVISEHSRKAMQAALSPCLIQTIAGGTTENCHPLEK